MSFLRQLQAHADYLAERGSGTIELSFDDINGALGEVERLESAARLAFDLLGFVLSSPIDRVALEKIRNVRNDLAAAIKAAKDVSPEDHD